MLKQEHTAQQPAMGKSDDSIQRRKNKKSRKKQDDKLSNRIAGIIAAKKRRLSGKRRMCEVSFTSYELSLFFWVLVFVDF